MNEIPNIALSMRYMTTSLAFYFKVSILLQSMFADRGHSRVRIVCTSCQCPRPVGLPLYYSVYDGQIERAHTRCPLA